MNLQNTAGTPPGVSKGGFGTLLQKYGKGYNAYGVYY